MVNRSNNGFRSRLTQKAYWADEPRVSASRYIIQRMIMHELGKPVGDVILPDKPQNAEGLDAETKKALPGQARPQAGRRQTQGLLIAPFFGPRCESGSFVETTEKRCCIAGEQP